MANPNPNPNFPQWRTDDPELYQAMLMSVAAAMPQPQLVALPPPLPAAAPVAALPLAAAAVVAPSDRAIGRAAAAADSEAAALLSAAASDSATSSSPTETTNSFYRIYLDDMRRAITHGVSAESFNAAGSDDSSDAEPLLPRPLLDLILSYTTIPLSVYRGWWFGLTSQLPKSIIRTILDWSVYYDAGDAAEFAFVHTLRTFVAPAASGGAAAPRVHWTNDWELAATRSEQSVGSAEFFRLLQATATERLLAPGLIINGDTSTEPESGLSDPRVLLRRQLWDQLTELLTSIDRSTAFGDRTVRYYASRAITCRFELVIVEHETLPAPKKPAPTAGQIAFAEATKAVAALTLASAKEDDSSTGAGGGGRSNATFSDGWRSRTSTPSVSRNGASAASAPPSVKPNAAAAAAAANADGGTGAVSTTVTTLVLSFGMIARSQYMHTLEMSTSAYRGSASDYTDPDYE